MEAADRWFHRIALAVVHAAVVWAVLVFVWFNAVGTCGWSGRHWLTTPAAAWQVLLGSILFTILALSVGCVAGSESKRSGLRWEVSALELGLPMVALTIGVFTIVWFTFTASTCCFAHYLP